MDTADLKQVIDSMTPDELHETLQYAWDKAEKFEQDRKRKQANDDVKSTEISCNVGTTVYCVWYSPCKHGETEPYGEMCETCSGECDMSMKVHEEKMKSVSEIFEKIGNQFKNGWFNKKGFYFLTKEEAEQVLEERE